MKKTGCVVAGLYTGCSGTEGIGGVLVGGMASVWLRGAVMSCAG